MFQESFLAFIKAKIGTMILFGALVAAISFFLLMVVEKRFQTSTDFLVVQNNVTNQDFYTQFKSSEYLGKILSEAVFSERFIDAVVQTGKINGDFLPGDKKDKMEAWEKMITVDKNLELGILSVTVKNNSEKDAARVSDGITQVLTEQNMLFRGGDQGSVDIRILSGPILERNPTLKKIAIVSGAGFVAGFLLTAGILLLLRELSFEKAEGKREDMLSSQAIEFTA